MVEWLRGGGFRHPDEGQFGGPAEPRELLGIANVSLEPFAPSLAAVPVDGELARLVAAEQPAFAGRDEVQELVRLCRLAMEDALGGEMRLPKSASGRSSNTG